MEENAWTKLHYQKRQQNSKAIYIIIIQEVLTRIINRIVNEIVNEIDPQQAEGQWTPSLGGGGTIWIL